VTTRRTLVVAMASLTAVAGALLTFAVRPGNSFTGDGASLVLGGLVLAIATDASMGAILMLRRPGNAIGFVLMFAAILSAITAFAWVSGAALAEQRGNNDLLAGILSLVGALGFIPSIIVGGPLLALLFPTGRLPDGRWRWPAGAIVAAIVVPSPLGLLHPGPIASTVVDNPFGASGFSGSEPIWMVGEALFFASLPVALLLAVAAVFVRFRRSEGIERAQLKWFVAAVFAAGTFVTLGFTDGGLDVGLAAGTSPTIFDVLAVASLSLPAIAVGVAILRYRLFEIDRIISRTIGWAIVTSILLAVFAGTVVGLQAILSRFTQGQTLAVAASTLVAFVLFQPVRRRVQSAVDRRFNRARYDAEGTAAAFAGRQRDQTNIAGLRVDLAGTIDAALHPQAVGVWIRPADHRGTP